MRTIAVIVAFGLIVVGFFWDVLIGPKVLIDANPALFDPWKAHASERELEGRTLQTDSFFEYYPSRVYLTQSLRAGRLPLWNPHVFAGMPFFADPQTRVLYPPQILLALADPARAMGYDVALHVFLAMIGMYLFLRALRLQAWGAGLGACAYAFSSFFYVQYGHPTLVATAAWIPFMFYGYEVALHREVAGTLVVTASLVMSYLAGFPQVFLFGVLALGAYAFYVALADAAGGRVRAVLRAGRILGAAGVLAALLVAIQMIPFLEFFRNSVGLAYDFEHIRDVMLAPAALLLRSLVPGFFGNPVDGTDWSGLARATVHPYNPEFAVYCGLGALVTALLALRLVRTSSRVRVLVVMLVLSVAVVVEQHLARIGYEIFPMFSASRPSRASVVSCFALSTLAAMGFSLVASRTDRALRKHVVMAAVGTVSAAILVAIIFELAGPSIIGDLAQKARAVPGDFWLKTQVLTRSGKIADWAQGNTAEWLAFERRTLLRGIVTAALTSGVLIVWCFVSEARSRLKSSLGALFVVVACLDILMIAGSYHLSQAKGSAGETDGIRVLKAVLGSGGAWRVKTVRGATGDQTALPANTNQIFDVPFLMGSSTVNTKAYETFKGAYLISKKDEAEAEGASVRMAPGISWLASRLDDLMSIRYVLAEEGRQLQASSSILRSIPADGSWPTRVRMLEVGGDRRLALCQGIGETVRSRVDFPPARLLCFSIGVDSPRGTRGDSVLCILSCQSAAGRIEWSRGLDLGLDGGKWQAARLDISPVAASPVELTLALRGVGSAPNRQARVGWSDFEFVLSECTVAGVDGSTARSGSASAHATAYEVTLDGPAQSLSVGLATTARDVPLDIRSENGFRTRFWFRPAGGADARQVRMNFAAPLLGPIFMRSDSTFRIENCRQVLPEFGIDSDCRLVYDQDMCIYENPRAVEKGICLDRGAVRVSSSEAGPVLALAGLRDVQAARCGRCSIVGYTPEEITLDAACDRAAVLIFQDMMYPGWKAYVDGVETDFVATDIGVRAIELASGDHSVVMAFRPRSFRVGLLLAALGALVTVAYATTPAWAARRRRAAPRRSQDGAPC